MTGDSLRRWRTSPVQSSWPCWLRSLGLRGGGRVLGTPISDLVSRGCSDVTRNGRFAGQSPCRLAISKTATPNRGFESLPPPPHAKLRLAASTGADRIDAPAARAVKVRTHAVLHVDLVDRHRQPRCRRQREDLITVDAAVDMRPARRAVGTESAAWATRRA